MVQTVEILVVLLRAENVAVVVLVSVDVTVSQMVVISATSGAVVVMISAGVTVSQIVVVSTTRDVVTTITLFTRGTDVAAVR